MSSSISGLQRFFVRTTLFHCAANRLNLVLCQSATSILVKVFFANLSAFSQGRADWGVWGRDALQYFKICKRVSQKAAVLEESWEK